MNKITGTGDFFAVTCEQELFCSKCDRPIQSGERFAYFINPPENELPPGRFDLCCSCFEEMTQVTLEFLIDNQDQSELPSQ